MPFKILLNANIRFNALMLLYVNYVRFRACFDYTLNKEKPAISNRLNDSDFDMY